MVRRGVQSSQVTKVQELLAFMEKVIFTCTSLVLLRSLMYEMHELLLNMHTQALNYTSKYLRTSLQSLVCNSLGQSQHVMIMTYTVSKIYWMYYTPRKPKCRNCGAPKSCVWGNHSNYLISHTRRITETCLNCQCEPASSLTVRLQPCFAKCTIALALTETGPRSHLFFFYY